MSELVHIGWHFRGLIRLRIHKLQNIVFVLQFCHIFGAMVGFFWGEGVSHTSPLLIAPMHVSDALHVWGTERQNNTFLPTVTKLKPHKA